jgi:hypothetical protein
MFGRASTGTKCARLQLFAISHKRSGRSPRAVPEQGRTRRPPPNVVENEHGAQAGTSRLAEKRTGATPRPSPEGIPPGEGTVFDARRSFSNQSRNIRHASATTASPPVRQ